MIRILSLMFLALVGSQAWADTLRCGSRIVSRGASAAEVLGACGEPEYRDVWHLRHPHGAGYVSDEEEWYYNFGPSQLLRILRLRNGKLAGIDSDGYGYPDSEGAAASDCAPSEIVEGISKFRLLLRCGEPVTRESAGLLRPLHDPETGARLHRFQQPVFREKWVYNFGSRYFLREVTLEDGRVVYVDQGARGFTP